MRVVSIFLALFLLCSCGGANASSKPGHALAPSQEKIAEELVIATNQHPTSLDPHAADENCSNRVFRLLYGTLLYFDPQTGQTVPHLAESYEQISDTEWVFSLRQGVLFHSGDEMTADDVKFSLERAKRSPRVKAQLAAVSSIEAVDRYTVRLRLTQPYLPLLAKLSLTGSSILCRRAAEEQTAFVPNGTGAYRLVEEIRGEKLTLERFPRYFKGASPTLRLVMRSIPDDGERARALETGQIHIAEWLRTEDFSHIVANPALSLLQTPSVTVAYLGFNVSKPPFDNRLVRRALAYAIDREALVRRHLLGNGKPALTVFGPGIPGYTEDVETFELDPERARSLLASAGYPDGIEATLLAAQSVFGPVPQMIVENFAAAGVTLTVEELPADEFFSRINAGEQQLHLGTWNTAIFDPDRSADPFYSGNFGSGSNRMLYQNERADWLIEEGRRESDSERRAEIYQNLQRLLVSDCVWIPLYNINAALGMAAGVRGVAVNPANQPDYSEVYLTLEP